MLAIAARAQEALREHGLAAEGWRFRWDQAKRRAGACHFRTKTISLSAPIFRLEANRSDVEDTILHEIAHALVGPGVPAHGRIWQLKALAIGAKPVRCHKLETPTPFVGVCECGPIHGRCILPKSQRRCKRCHGPVTWARRDGHAPAAAPKPKPATARPSAARQAARTAAARKAWETRRKRAAAQSAGMMGPESEPARADSTAESAGPTILAVDPVDLPLPLP